MYCWRRCKSDWLLLWSTRPCFHWITAGHGNKTKMWARTRWFVLFVCARNHDRSIVHHLWFYKYILHVFMYVLVLCTCIAVAVNLTSSSDCTEEKEKEKVAQHHQWRNQTVSRRGSEDDGSSNHFHLSLFSLYLWHHAHQRALASLVIRTHSNSKQSRLV